ncbi:PdxA family dehydrogenase [Halalkalibacterium ligniniphilum]|uniref:PdxA family dehydrogenase n=1 Tax=Halalkalibacterium ligniniphilum TaxID=1134413 RepID=UPI0003463D09|nr:4-hydroxythreonine-4-phosphate dehydrogenase PdxA [Halalkalibacterium ligniniphilum]
MNESKEKPIIAITIGDPAGIGPEIVLKAMKTEKVFDQCKPVIIGNVEVLKFYNELLDVGLHFHLINDIQNAKFIKGTVDVFNMEHVSIPEIKPGESNPMNGIAMLKYTESAVQLALKKEVHAVIGGPHTKKSVELAGVPFDGYPGFVSKLANTPQNEHFLMLVSDNLRIVNVTLHVSLRKALTMINKQLIYHAIRATYQTLKNLGIHSPKIAVSGLNPHAGEGGLFGTEEIEEIVPAIRKAREEEINVDGPFSPDTMLLEYDKNKYDAYIAMYHDQAHIPIKALSFGKISAMTIGTPIIFCTVGHGSAPDIAGKGEASPESLLKTIERLM